MSAQSRRASVEVPGGCLDTPEKSFGSPGGADRVLVDGRRDCKAAVKAEPECDSNEPQLS